MSFSVFFNHLSGGGVDANHNSTRTPSLDRKNKTKKDSRLLKNSEGNRDDEWNFCKEQEADIAVLYSCKRQEKERSEKFSEKTSRLFPETGPSQATNRETQRQTKWIEFK